MLHIFCPYLPIGQMSSSLNSPKLVYHGDFSLCCNRSRSDWNWFILLYSMVAFKRERRRTAADLAHQLRGTEIKDSKVKNGSLVLFPSQARSCSQAKLPFRKLAFGT